jgi:hypothetical protein
MAKKRPKHGLDQENLRSVTAHSVTTQLEGDTHDVTRDRVGHNQGISITKPEICSRRDRTQDQDTRKP